MHAKSDLLLFRSQNQGATWTQVREFSNPVGVPTITLPVLASDSAGRLALEYIQSDSTDALAEPVFATVVFDATAADPSPAPPDTAWAFDVMTSGFYDPSPGDQVRAIGDYNSIAVMDPAIQTVCTAQSGFLPAWTDTLGPSPDPFNVHVQQMAVTP